MDSNLGPGIIFGLGIAGLATGAVLKLLEWRKQEVLVRELPPTIPHYYDDYEDLRNSLKATSTGDLQEVLVEGKVIASPDFNPTNEIEAAIHKLGPAGKLCYGGTVAIEGSSMVPTSTTIHNTTIDSTSASMTSDTTNDNDSTATEAGWFSWWEMSWQAKISSPPSTFSVPFTMKSEGKDITIKNIEESENWAKVLVERSLDPVTHKLKLQLINQSSHQEGIKYDMLLYGSTIAVVGNAKLQDNNQIILIPTKVGESVRSFLPKEKSTKLGKMTFRVLIIGGISLIAIGLILHWWIVPYIKRRSIRAPIPVQEGLESPKATVTT